MSKKWVRLYDEQRDGRFWLNPFYHSNLLESFTKYMETDGYDRKLILAKVDEISATEWQLGVLEDWGAQDTFPLHIKCIDERQRIYQFMYKDGSDDNGRFSGTFLAVDQSFVPEFYPDGEHYSKYNRIIDHRFSVNGITAPAPVYFLRFYNARKNFLEKYGDYTAMEVESIESYIERERAYHSYKGKWQIVADRTCAITFPGFSGEFPHRYVLARIDVPDQIYNLYYFYVFAKLSDKYSCILASDFSPNKSVDVKLDVICSETAPVPFAWDEEDTNARYWEHCHELSGCYTKGGFSFYFDDCRSDYIYVVQLSENTLKSPLHLIPDVRWRLMKATEGDEEMYILSESESLVLGSGEESYISTHALYYEKLRQGLIEEEGDDYSPDE